MEAFWSGLQQVRRLYFHRLEATCRQWGITRAEMDVLLFLYHNPEHNRSADIVEMQGLTKSHVSITARALEQRQLLRFAKDEQDQRVTRLYLTEAALEVVAAGKAAQNDYYDDMFAGFTAEEIRQWRTVAEKMLANVQAMSGKE